MPLGKPAGVRCIQLGDDARCRIFGQPERPAVCSGLMPQPEMCGESAVQALAYLSRLERLTQPGPEAASTTTAKQQSSAVDGSEEPAR